MNECTPLMDPITLIDSITDVTQTQNIPSHTTSALESEHILYLPNCFFQLKATEACLLSESMLHPKHKNISYHRAHQRMAGSAVHQHHALMKQFMHRFSEYAKALIDTLMPEYTPHLRFGRTSYRPAEIKGRATSKRKDDTRVHVDAFAATPVNGLRILRVFCNINPYGEPRVWHVGEPFHQVLETFEPTIPPYRSARSALLQFIKVTKTHRSAYDHYMLHLHDQMKLDDNYQSNIAKQRIAFPSNSTWIVFTDQVSHAALSGQFLLEQTFYLPVNAMLNPELSPLRIWEKKKKRSFELGSEQAI